MPGTLINRLSFLALGGLMVLQFGVFEQSPTNPVGIRYVGEQIRRKVGKAAVG